MKAFYLLILIVLVSCSGEVVEYKQEDTVISVKGQGSHSTTAGNLIASAIREVHELDVVLYPTDLIRSNEAGLLSSEMNTTQFSQLLEVYPTGGRDEFWIGTMQGSDLKTFIRQRTMERFDVDLEVAGLFYEIIYKGGFLISESFSLPQGSPIRDDQNYQVAISTYHASNFVNFPTYKYRNSIDRVFNKSNKTISARKSLEKFLSKKQFIPFLNRKRAIVKKTQMPYAGEKSISTVQGISHLSPFLGHSVTIKGIVTATGKVDNYPGGFDIYVQSQTPDNDPRTSEGIKVHFSAKEGDPKLTIGDLVKITGTVYEESNHIAEGLTTTSIREIKSFKKLESSVPLPKAIHIGKKGRALPGDHHSTFNGNLNRKPSLKLTDGIDFWESLEGMRITMSNPRVVGFRGGRESSDETKSHLTLYVKPDGKKQDPLYSPVGGILADTDKHDHNSEIIPIASGAMTKGLFMTGVFNVGDIIEGEITGLVSFSKNLFGDAEYVMNLPEVQEDMTAFNDLISGREFVTLSERPVAEFNQKENELTIAAYNVKNLSSKNKQRISETASMIDINLECPDILGLVEIQDNNGEDFSGGSEADETIKQIIEKTTCKVNYQVANIDPLIHREGGIPGGNIRVAVMYNADRLGFKENLLPTAMTETLITPNGDLSYNPGRVFPNDPAFRNSRKSIVVQFEFKGQPVFVIVNHLNSKLSDTSHFSAIQPSFRGSEIKRAAMARALNRFVGMIEKNNPNAHIAVIGDFNAYLNEAPMQVLEGGGRLYNLIRDLPKDQRYTTNHNGNSQSLDYIFINKNFKARKPQFKALQINSDFMGRLSDHDPVTSKFSF